MLYLLSPLLVMRQLDEQLMSKLSLYGVLSLLAKIIGPCNESRLVIVQLRLARR